MIKPKFVVLDPTGIYPVPKDYTSIATEREWIEFFGRKNCNYWVKGKRICDWTREWLRVWNQTDLIVEEKKNPRSHFEALLAPIAIPPDLNDSKILALVTQLESYRQDNPIAYLLSEVTDNNLWFAKPSIDHLAHWLSIQVPEEYQLLEQAWQHQTKEKTRELANYYQTQNKLSLLKSWLGLTQSSVVNLDPFPHNIPVFLVQEFKQFWEKQIIKTKGKVLETLATNQQAGMSEITSYAYNILKDRPSWITQQRISKLSAYLTSQQRNNLNKLQQPSIPQTLNIDADSQKALKWVTESYLPFRRWEITINRSPTGKRASDSIANSFVEWIVKHYPDLKLDPVPNSTLNYSVASRVQKLCEETPVLWVVVDGLGWLDHQELVAILTEKNSMAVETALSPRFSILPTKTEYAKWSLYTQLLPNDSTWNANAGNGFPRMGMGERYTDNRRHKLYKALQDQKHQLYCWDSDELDKLYHQERDWQNLYQVQRPHTLEKIAREIEYCLAQYPHPEQLRVVISSDHGQMIGEIEQLTQCPEGITAKGRMGIGKTDDTRFVVCEAGRFGLPHDVSIVKGAACLKAFNRTMEGEVIGTHGGLFPEEVVVGVSVLRQFVERYPVIVFCEGEGKAKQPGYLTITIDNSNEVPLTDLYLQINELTSLKTGISLKAIIPAKERVTLKIDLPEFPELRFDSEGNQIFLSGQLSFRFADTESRTSFLESDSIIKIEQMFRSGFDIDEFLE
ncbi:MAG: hypothetical protein ACLFT0_14240 [Spirulinaceae cyanobacterium]